MIQLCHAGVGTSKWAVDNIKGIRVIFLGAHVNIWLASLSMKAVPLVYLFKYN